MTLASRTLHGILLAFWAALSLGLLAFVGWLALAHGGGYGEAGPVWVIMGLVLAGLALVPPFGHVLVLRGHGGGGVLLVAVCGLGLLRSALTLPGLVSPVGFNPYPLLWTGFFAVNAWSGLRAMVEARP